MVKSKNRATRASKSEYQSASFLQAWLNARPAVVRDDERSALQQWSVLFALMAITLYLWEHMGSAIGGWVGLLSMVFVSVQKRVSRIHTGIFLAALWTIAWVPLARMLAYWELDLVSMATYAFGLIVIFWLVKRQ